MRPLFLLVMGRIRTCGLCGLQRELFEWEISLHKVQKIPVVHHQGKLLLVDEVEISFHVAVADMKCGQQTLGYFPFNCKRGQDRNAQDPRVSPL